MEWIRVAKVNIGRVTEPFCDIESAFRFAVAEFDCQVEEKGLAPDLSIDFCQMTKQEYLDLINK